MNVCIFGDSIAWGACDYERGGWVECLKTFLMENREDVDVYNLGISGNDTQDLLKRFDAEVAAREAENEQVIIFAIGMNDSQYVGVKSNPRVSLEEFKNNISILITKARKIAHKIIFISPTRVDESKVMPIPWDASKYYENKIIRKYDSALRKICKDNKLPFIDLFDLLTNSDLEDGLHPNSKGHVKIFNKIRPVIEKVIDQP